YYLHHQDLTQGSERLWLEVRDRDSGLVIERRALQAAQDYDINYLQGRVTLRTPLSSESDSSSLFRTSGLAGNPAYLVATYEYVPGLTAVRGSAAGLRAGSWLNDHVGVGLTAFHQGEDSSAQDLRGLDATLRYTSNTWLKMEAARSRGAAQSVLSSVSGGFESDTLTSNGGRGDAKRVQATADLADLGGRGRVSAYWQDRGVGFSGPGQITLGGEATRQHGAAATLPIGQATEFGLNVDARDALSQSARSAEAALRHKVDAQWGVSAGVRRDDRSNGLNVQPTASAMLNQHGRRDDVVLRVDYRPLAEGQDAGAALPSVAGMAAAPASSLMSATNPAMGASGERRRVDATGAAGIAGARVDGLAYRDWSLYGFVQHTLARTGDRSLGDRAGIGGSWQASERIKLNAEASGGSGGGGGQLGASYRVSERSDLYLAYTLETESPNVNYAGREGALTGGTHYRLNDQTAVFAESRWQNGAGPQSLTHAFGVDLAPSAQWSVGVKAETGTLSDPLAGDITRKAIGLSASYRHDDTRWTTALEYRTDSTARTVHGQQGEADERRSWSMRNSLGLQLDPAWRVLGKLNVARSVASKGAFYDGDYSEAVLGAAYRPVSNDRVNGLVKYTYFYNLPASSQVDNSFGTPLDFKQKSHVLNADLMVDVTPWMSVGGKLGLRMGEVAASRTSDEWHDSRATLAVLRADWHWVREWDAIAEVRRLAVREAQDARSGALLGIYRHVGQHAKIGVGYNFTRFSDDLTDMSYRSRGWFINALGTF
ncbi:MAG: OmpA family protein, partial [Gammaproteobacteria bacterium]